jgi:hypothetical protein
MGGTVARGAAASNAARQSVVQTAPVGYLVCSGGHASRFPEHEKTGRVCRPLASLQAIY